MNPDGVTKAEYPDYYREVSGLNPDGVTKSCAQGDIIVRTDMQNTSLSKKISWCAKRTQGFRIKSPPGFAGNCLMVYKFHFNPNENQSS